MERNTNQNTQTYFDKDKISELFISLLPETHPSRNKKDTITTIKSYWKKGEMTRIEINDIDWTSYIPRAKYIIKDILYKSNKFKKNFYGSVILIGYFREGKLEHLNFGNMNRVF